MEFSSTLVLHCSSVLAQRWDVGARVAAVAISTYGATSYFSNSKIQGGPSYRMRMRTAACCDSS